MEVSGRVKVVGAEQQVSPTFKKRELVVTTDEATIQKYIEDFKKEFVSLPAEEISFPRSVNGLKTYSDKGQIYTKGTPIHVKGALLYNHYLAKLKLDKKYPKIQEGEKLKFTYLRQPNPINDTVISYPSRLPPEMNLDNYIDRDLQFEKTFLEPIKIILDCIGWQPEKTNSLDAFF